MLKDRIMYAVTDFDFLMKKPVEDKLNGMDTKILGVFGSVESLILTFGTIISAILVIICALKMISMNKNRIGEEKSRLYVLLGCMVFFFGLTTIIGFVVGVTKSLFSPIFV